MAGSFIGKSPWGRQAIDRMAAEDREALEARIPDGHVVSVGAETRFGDWNLYLLGPTYRGERRHTASIEVGTERLLEMAGCLE